jgi:hypothetical protein
MFNKRTKHGWKGIRYRETCAYVDKIYTHRLLRIKREVCEICEHYEPFDGECFYNENDPISVHEPFDGECFYNENDPISVHEYATCQYWKLMEVRWKL